MEIWLSYNNNAERLRLPVHPPSLEISTGNENKVVNINDAGELNLIGRKKLDSLSIEAFFPNRDYTFLQYNNPPKPYECVALIDKWRLSGKPIRVVVTGTPINLSCAIDTFTYGERDLTGDVYYTLELSEYRFLAGQSKKDEYQAEVTRPVVNDPPKTYTVKKGETLWNIAKKLTGNGNNYLKIAEKNGLKNPNKIYPGMKLVI